MRSGDFKSFNNSEQSDFTAGRCDMQGPRTVETRKPGLRQFRKLSRELFLRDVLSRYMSEDNAKALSHNLFSIWKYYPDRYGQIDDAERRAYKAYLKWMQMPDSERRKQLLDDELERCQYIYYEIITRFYRMQEVQAQNK